MLLYEMIIFNLIPFRVASNSWLEMTIIDFDKPIYSIQDDDDEHNLHICLLKCLDVI